MTKTVNFHLLSETVLQRLCYVTTATGQLGWYDDGKGCGHGDGDKDDDNDDGQYLVM